MKKPWKVIGLVALILIVASFIYSNSISDDNNIGVDISKTYIKGNPDAPVTLTEYSDFQCPACAAFQPVLADIMNQFGNDIRFEYKHFPLAMHPLAFPAARAAEAAGQQDKFFEFHDMLFEEQKTWTKSPNPNVLFVQYAEELGLDAKKFRQHMDASLLTDRIKTDKEAGDELGITGTPTFYLNGEKMTVTSYEEFYKQIASTINPDIKFDLVPEGNTGL